MVRFMRSTCPLSGMMALVPLCPAALFGEKSYGEPIWDTGAPGARRCGQAANRPWVENPSSLHGRPLRLARMRRERGSVGVVLPARSRLDEQRLEGSGHAYHRT